MSLTNKNSSLYKYYDVNFYRINKDKWYLSKNDQNVQKIYLDWQVQILLNCSKFRTIEEHSNSFLNNTLKKKLDKRSLITRIFLSIISKILKRNEDLLYSNLNKVEVINQLEKFRNDGFLISKQEIFRNIVGSDKSLNKISSPKRSISTLGIPSKNRPKLLLRCVESFLEKIETEREFSLRIVDDSASPNIQNQKKIKNLCSKYHVDLDWIDINYRHNFSHEIAKKSKVPVNVVNFALLGRPKFEFSTGASRNTLLLLSAGDQSIQVDDDIICKIISPPWKKQGLALNGVQSDFQEYKYYTDPLKFHETLKENNVDFFSTHEEILGLQPHHIIKNFSSVNTESINNRLLNKINDPKSRVAISFNGIYGDSGMANNWQRLCLEGKSFNRLVNNEKETYEKYLCTRNLLRSVDKMTLGDTQFCMAGVIGLDTTHLLPPFMPAMRNEDGIFGLILHLCFKNSIKGFIPDALLHAPPIRTGFKNKKKALKVTPFRVSDIISSIIWSLESWPFTSDNVSNLQILGQLLKDLSSLSYTDFESEIRNYSQRILIRRINFLQNLSEKHNNSLFHWQSDIEYAKNSSIELLNNNEFYIPSDIKSASKARLTVLREFINEYGILLENWPLIWNAAIKLRK